MRRFLRRMRQAIADAADNAARSIGYYPVADMFALQDKFVGMVDAKRTDNEMLRLTVNEYEAQIEDIRAVRQEVASIAPDAPPIMLKHAIKRQDHLLETLIVRVERRVKARERTKLQQRAPNGRFVLEDRR